MKKMFPSNLKSQNHQQIMQQAINKASGLIDLLSSQNQELKIKLQKSDQLLQVITQNNQEAIDYNIKLKEDLQRKDRQLNELSRQLEEKYQIIAELETKIQEKIIRNKGLHDKIGDMTMKNQELKQQIEQQNRLILSIENQNEYLLKNISTHQMRQNQIIEKCDLNILQSQKQMIQKERSKQAFARRCQQLKLQNQDLVKRMQIMQRKLILAESKKNNLQRQVRHQRQRDISKQNVDSGQVAKPVKIIKNVGSIKQSQTELAQLKDIQKIIDEIINSSLSLKNNPDLSLKQKLQHINNFVSYRLKHIESILLQITMRLQMKVTLIKGPALKQIHLLAIRLETYLHELLK